MADAASMAAPPGPPIKERAPRARPIPTEAALAAAAARADAAACAVSACAKTMMLHLLLIVSCRIGLMLWMRIGVRKYYTFHTSLYAKEISASVLSPISSSVHSSLLP